MNILAPATDFETAKAVIDAGCGEVYFAFDENFFYRLSFTGRGKMVESTYRTVCSSEELGHIVDYAHERNVKLNLLCNMPYLYQLDTYDSGTNTIQSLVKRYIDFGISQGVDSLVVGNMGLLNWVNEQKYDIGIHASVYFRTMNLAQIEFLKGFNVNRVALPYNCTLEEIHNITSNNIVDVEVLGYLGCSFINGACNFLHDIGEEQSCDGCGITCKGVYSVKCRNEFLKNSRIFDDEKGCSLCSLNALKDIGVSAVKIVGRDRNSQLNVELVRIFKTIIDNDIRDYESIKKLLPSWWTRVWCRGQRCKFMYSDYFIR